MRYVRPKSLAELLALVAEEGANARLVAGGTDLWLQVRAGQEAPLLVNVFRIPELRGIAVRGERLEIGATETVAALLRSPEVAAAAPLLRQAADHFASPLVRSRATVGGNLANASPAADLTLALLALDAQVHLASLAGSRSMSVADFVLGPRRTAIRPDEVVTGVGVPVRAGRLERFEKSGPRPALEIAVAAVAVALSLDGEGRVVEPRVCCGAVAPVPMRAAGAERALAGRDLSDAAIAAAARAAGADVRPIDDVRGTALHRRRLVAAFVRRALEAVRDESRRTCDVG
jgi:carbon-monoxide dehydrogenase medium subunit